MLMLENGTESFVGPEQLILTGNITRWFQSEHDTDIVESFKRFKSHAFRISFACLETRTKNSIFFGLKAVKLSKSVLK